jgi:hypothetical protein
MPPPEKQVTVNDVAGVIKATTIRSASITP